MPQSRSTVAMPPCRRQRGANRFYPDDVRISACADYLLGKSYLEIEGKWDVNMSTVLNWIRKTGHFKLRNEHTKDRMS